jgi:hypothetical protein
MNVGIIELAEVGASKGAIVCGSKSVRWPLLGRKRRTAKVVVEMTSLFRCPRKEEA